MRGLSLFALGLVVVLPLGSVKAQSSSRTFPETGKTVSGKFLDYWNAHGGLAQQGFPISGEMQEKSDTDGKTYTVQYFERAVFELHPENAAPNDVLLSLLGNFLYKQKYPSGAPGQQPNTNIGSMLFTQTGKRLGGLFLQYWQQHGGLAQQGYPISDQFTEKSALDGKTYTVQYFERAVFERHPENTTPYDVLLSQLGTFRYRDKYGSGSAGATATATPRPPAAPTATPQAAVQQMSVTVREGAVDTGAANLTAGNVKITVSNIGVMEHNLTIADSTGQILASTPNFRSSDGAQTLTVNLQAGTYKFYCSLPGHAQRGQSTQVIVR
jgi:hypothetical protein